MYKFGRNKLHHSEKKYGQTPSKASKNSPNPTSAGVLYPEPTGGLLTRSNFLFVYNSKSSPYQNMYLQV
jgi:hypothetical protein